MVMAGLGLILSWSGYLLFVWGYTKVRGAYKGTHLSIADLALPSHRTTYLNGMHVISGVGTTGGLPGGQAEKDIAIAQATKDMQTTCAQYGPTSPQCKEAKTRLSNVKSAPLNG